MNDADLARLAVAKRAYEVARPSEAEVLTGVRRARLAFRRSKPRRKWLSKGLVFVVLAIGSLAYAKPHALGELIEQALHAPARGGKAPVRGGSAALPAQVDAAARLQLPVGQAPAAPAPVDQGAPSQAAPNEATRIEAEPSQAAPDNAAPNEAAPHEAAPDNAAAISKPRAAGNAAARTTAAATNAAPSLAVAAATPTPGQLQVAAASPSREKHAATEWGRVGQALARGDERAALLSLNELADSDDPRTRDKADLGRAQLLLSHGNRERACALARSLTLRHPGERVERQAQVLLKGCNR